MIDLKPLPLANQRSEQRRGESHAAVVTAHLRPDADALAQLAAATAALVYRYTDEHAIRVRIVARDESVRNITILLNDESTAEGTINAIEGDFALSAEAPFHAIVNAGGSHADNGASLSINLDANNGISLRMAKAEFDASAVTQYAHHLSRLLKAAKSNWTTRLADVSMLSDEEIRRAVIDWNDTETEIPDDYFHQRVAKVAREQPDKTAIQSSIGSISYSHLDSDANRLAHHLIGLGVNRNDRVAVCFPRSIEAIVAQLACFKLGASAILLDPDFPKERLQFMIRDAEAIVVLTMDAHAELIGASPITVSLDHDEWRDQEPTPIDAELTPEDLIHICYTSGSTGTPKAVMVRHGAARNLIWSMEQACELQTQSRGAWLAAPGYGMVEVEVFPVLASGATVHIPDASVVPSPERLQSWILEYGITHVLLMKTMAQRLWALDWPAKAALRNIRVCGERVLTWPRPDLPFNLINLYGSAEATVVALCDLTSLAAEIGTDGQEKSLPPIGRPTANVASYVLDQLLRPTAPGVVGELCIAGESLSAGYLNQPSMTSEKWIDNPYDSERRPLLYRTGDLARYWPDGNIEIVGRTDSQVKVRGNRVHLGEIESVLATLPGVEQAVVIAKYDASGDAWLAAYIEPVAGMTPATQHLRAALLRQLPTFMIPGAFLVGSFPLNVNGKIDRQALPDVERSRAFLDAPYVPPTGSIETMLVSMWEELLEIELVGVHDNFFALGGDSLHAARLAENLQKILGSHVELDEIFAGQATIRSMAEEVSIRRGACRSDSVRGETSDTKQGSTQ